MTAYYNDVSAESCAWLTELAKAGHIEPGTIDGRSIADVRGTDLEGYTRVHFFAGIGGWDYALRLAGWPADVPIWTGSCPCQPFSCAGKQRGTADERHLWPEFARLIRECRPPFIFGEQVASAEVVGTGTEADFLVAVQAGDYARANKLAKRLAQSSTFHYMPRWLDGIRADLEGAGYTVWSAVAGAHSVGAPHIRQRLYWVAVAGHGRESWRGLFGPREGYGAACERASSQPCGSSCARGLQHTQGDGRGQRRAEPSGRGVACGCEPYGLPDAGGQRRNGQSVFLRERGPREAVLETAWCGGPERLADSGGTGLEGRTRRECAGQCATRESMPWSNYTVIPFRDGKQRRVEPGSFPVVDGFPGRVGLLRGYGNAIVPQVAAAFVAAVMDHLPDAWKMIREEGK